MSFRPARQTAKTVSRFVWLLFIFQIPIFPQTGKADLVLLNADIRTMDRAKARADALAVTRNKISAVGTNREIRALVGAQTKILDAQGKLVIPGFNDSHVHFLGIGNQFFSINLSDAKTPGEMVERIKNYVRFLPKGSWILGGAWNHENWTPPAPLPTKELLDAATPDHPVFIYHANPRIALANSAALRLARIDKNTKDSAGGLIERDARGEPTGILRDAALNLVRKLLPVSAIADKSAVAETATNYAASLGVTSVQDMQADNNVEIYRELDRRGKLKTRIYDCTDLSDWPRSAADGLKRADGEALLVRTGCLKGFSDGDAAAMPKLYNQILAGDRAGLQILMHAIGRDANRIVLTMFERVAKENGARDRRFRVEHAHNFRAEDLKRFSRSKIIASMQPFLFFNGEETLEPYRQLLDSGALLAFGSDSSIIDLNPLNGIYAAVYRRNSNNKNFTQTISVEEAVRAYTAGSAYAEFQENVKGTLSVGKLADFIILSDDIFSIDPKEIPKTKVLMTVVDGRVVFEDN